MFEQVRKILKYLSSLTDDELVATTNLITIEIEDKINELEARIKQLEDGGSVIG